MGGERDDSMGRERETPQRYGKGFGTSYFLNNRIVTMSIHFMHRDNGINH